MLKRLPLLRSFAFTFAASAVLALSANAQAPHPLTAADRQHIDEIVHKMTLAEKLDYIGGMEMTIRAVPSVNVRALQMSDGPVGVRLDSGFPSTTYSAGIGLAASWDRELAQRVGAGIGRDARARGINFMLGPGVNIYRSPRNGRNFEYFGEDPFLTSNIAVGYITGMQEQGVSSTIKHYVGNNSEFLRHDSDSIIDARAMHEIYLPSFEAAVKKAHVGAVMDSYNFVDGVHSTQNPHINIDIMRKEFGFEGTMMSDWDATYDGVAAANGGLDIEMPKGKFMNRANLEPAIKDGKVSEATIDEKVRHILSTAVMFGWLDRDQTDTSISYVDRNNRETALDSARESPVLLKNEDNLLPLDKSQIKNILVVGPDAYPGVPVGGGSAGVQPFHTISPLEGLTDALGDSAKVFYDRGLPTISELADATAFTTEATNGKPGLTMEFYTNDQLTGHPERTTVVEHLNFKGTSWDSVGDDPEFMAALLAGRNKHQSRRFTGYFTAPDAGKYIVALEDSGEGSANRVYLDGKLIFDNWELVRAFQPHLTIELSAGPHKIVAEDRQTFLIGGRLRLAIVDENKVVNARAKELAAKADVVVVAAGFSAASESEGGDRTFALPYGQDELVQAMAAANKKVIVAVTSGGNVDSNAWLDHVPALLETWYGGQDGGRALAEILLGEVNPSGHLPATFERHAEDNPTFANYYPEPGTKRVVYKEGIFVGYRGYEHNHVKPLFPFGYGLSYTTFKFANLAVSPESAGANPQVNVTFDVTNTGSRKGAEVAQVYVSPEHAKMERPERELKGFERVELAPGETKHVSVTLDARAFAYWNKSTSKWTFDPGKFTVHVGDSVESTPLSGAVELTSEAANSNF
ncbi:MAG: beta-glucosidase [Acidobacteriaceae bacterium]|jgi:beta-glucosidase|nr:beta-glucosidase [Acidobacteriaceae bacterium]